MMYENIIKEFNGFKFNIRNLEVLKHELKTSYYFVNSVFGTGRINEYMYYETILLNILNLLINLNKSLSFPAKTRFKLVIRFDFKNEIYDISIIMSDESLDMIFTYDPKLKTFSININNEIYDDIKGKDIIKYMPLSYIRVKKIKKMYKD